MTTSRILAWYQNPRKLQILANSVIRHGQLSACARTGSMRGNSGIHSHSGLDDCRGNNRHIWNSLSLPVDLDGGASRHMADTN